LSHSTQPSTSSQPILPQHNQVDTETTVLEGGDFTSFLSYAA